MQELNERLDDGRTQVALLNADAAQLAGLVSGPATARITDILNSNNKKFQIVEDQLSKQTGQLKLHQQKSAEVCLGTLTSLC